MSMWKRKHDEIQVFRTCLFVKKKFTCINLCIAFWRRDFKLFIHLGWTSSLLWSITAHLANMTTTMWNNVGRYGSRRWLSFWNTMSTVLSIPSCFLTGMTLLKSTSLIVSFTLFNRFAARNMINTQLRKRNSLWCFASMDVNSSIEICKLFVISLVQLQ